MLEVSVAQAARIRRQTFVPFQNGLRNFYGINRFSVGLEIFLIYLVSQLLIILCSTDTGLYPEPGEFYPRFCLSYLFKLHNQIVLASTHRFSKHFLSLKSPTETLYVFLMSYACRILRPSHCYSLYYPDI